jgi:hypothetical protein
MNARLLRVGSVVRRPAAFKNASVACIVSSSGVIRLFAFAKQAKSLDAESSPGQKSKLDTDCRIIPTSEGAPACQRILTAN